MYIFCYLFPLEAWVAAMIRVCRQFFWTVRGKKRYQNDTRTIPQNAIWEPWAGGRPPTHPPEQNIDTLSLGATYSHSIFHGWKQWLEKRKRRTKQSNRYSTLPWQCASQNADMILDQIQYPISLVASLDWTQSQWYAVPPCWNGTSFTSIEKVQGHTHTHKQRVSFLQCRRKGLSVVLPLDARRENGVLSLSLLHPPMLCRFVYR